MSAARCGLAWTPVTAELADGAPSMPDTSVANDCVHGSTHSVTSTSALNRASITDESRPPSTESQGFAWRDREA